VGIQVTTETWSETEVILRFYFVEMLFVILHF
jgi:hypothetical protein